MKKSRVTPHVTIRVSPDAAAIIDAADLPLVSRFSWQALRGKSRRTTYAIAADGVLMHRLIMGCEPGDGKKVDHRDHDGLNNRRENLRLCTQSENCANQRRRVGTKSGFKGVSPAPLSSMPGWRAEVRKRVNGRMDRHYLGLFPTAEQAARAYDRKAVELFGEFASLNFPAHANN